MFALLSVNFNDRRYNDYFYTVNPVDATGTRPVYHARAGYVMSDLSLGLIMPISNLQIFLFGTLESLHGSVNSNSPLFRREWNSGVSLVFIWALAQSKTQVQSFK
jgi:outer membrane scaffolding protein for murein synthesis (MipA/OmpV family)